MARNIPYSRSKIENDSLNECLWKILDTHRDVSGFIHLLQRQEDGSNLHVEARRDDFPFKFWHASWEFENGYPIDMYFRQQSYFVPWIKAGYGQYPPVENIISLAIDLEQ